jgi:hypothetical protein
MAKRPSFRPQYGWMLINSTHIADPEPILVTWPDKLNVACHPMVHVCFRRDVRIKTDGNSFGMPNHT